MTKQEKKSEPQAEASEEEVFEERTEADSVNELLKEELEKRRQETDALKETNLRQLAELENTRKRLQKEREELTKYAVCKFAEEFLSPLDQLDRALACADQMSDEVKNWAIGFKMILSQFEDVLANQNIQNYSALGQTFDPHLHEAVEAVETEDKPEGTVIEELVKGYKMGDYIVRPAKVKVAKKPATSPAENHNEKQ